MYPINPVFFQPKQYIFAKFPEGRLLGNIQRFAAKTRKSLLLPLMNNISFGHHNFLFWQLYEISMHTSIRQHTYRQLIT